MHERDLAFSETETEHPSVGVTGGDIVIAAAESLDTSNAFLDNPIEDRVESLRVPLCGSYEVLNDSV